MEVKKFYRLKCLHGGLRSIERDTDGLPHLSRKSMNELVVITPEPTQEYVSLVSHIANLWEDARNNAITAVNESLLKASWETGQYIVEFEQEGNAKARYGKRLLV